MAKSLIEDLIRTARNKNNPYWERRQALELAKYDINKLQEEILSIEFKIK